VIFHATRNGGVFRGCMTDGTLVGKTLEMRLEFW